MHSLPHFSSALVKANSAQRRRKCYCFASHCPISRNQRRRRSSGQNHFPYKRRSKLQHECKEQVAQLSADKCFCSCCCFFQKHKHALLSQIKLHMTFYKIRVDLESAMTITSYLQNNLFGFASHSFSQC